MNDKHDKTIDQICELKTSRRTFLGTTALLGGTALFSETEYCKVMAGPMTDSIPNYNYDIQDASNIIYGVCLQCHTKCPIKGKTQDGLLVKIDGNPYAPNCMLTQLDYETDIKDAAKFDGKLCPKGQASIQTIYDPYRVLKVLKRNGPRGSNKWKSINFDVAINEVVNGGKLFKDIGENQHIEGFKDIYVLKNPNLSKAMSEDAKAVGKNKMSVAEFKQKYKNNLDVLIDPDHPDLGPKNNQFVFLAGRIQHGRKEFAKRFTLDGLCSKNFFEHTSICEQSHHIAYEQTTSKYEDGKWGKGKSHMKPDALNSEFIIYFGTGAFEANFGPTVMAEKVTRGLRNGQLKIAVVDPRHSKTAAKAKWWAPIIPGTDGALALAMIQWIIENERYDKKFLENATKKAALNDNEYSYSTSPYLVKIEKDGPGSYLRASEVGKGNDTQFVVSRNGQLLAVDPHDEFNAVEGDLFVDTTANGIKIKSAFQILKDSASSRTLEEYSKITGVDVKTIVELSDELTSHGKKAAVEFYRGTVQHTSGYYNAQALIMLNVLIGNIDHKGGLSVGGGHWHEMGGKPASKYDKLDKAYKGHNPFGPPITREKSKYEDFTLFKEGYPAKRPWFPNSNNIYQEVIPSAADGYPYPIKILYHHMGTVAFATPAGNHFIPILQDTKKIPLFISSDIIIGETSMYADYIFPDVTFLERFGIPHNTPDEQTADSKIRQPMATALTEVVNVDGIDMPVSMETFLITVGKKIGLPGIGKDGIGPGMNLDCQEDFYLKAFVNLAYGDKPNEEIPDASAEEEKIFFEARKHLPEHTFSEKRYKNAIKEDEWKKLIYLLNRGGRFENFDKAYKGDFLSHKFKNLLSVYAEPVALTKNSITGERFSGVPIYVPCQNCTGKVIEDNDYPFYLVSYKEICGGHSRTIGNYWTVGALPENKILINKIDADKYKLKDDDQVHVVSKSNPEGIIDLGNGTKKLVIGKVMIIQGIRPGVLAISWHYGHWAYGSSDVTIDGKLIKGEKCRGTGICGNPLSRLDDKLKNVCLTDPIGASSIFTSKVNIKKV